jgi:YVTN family beta-propeller protein
VGVNPLTNKAYVANFNDNTVTVVDGALNVPITTVSAGSGPIAVAVNSVTNKIYVANVNFNAANGSVTVIDGVTNATTTVATGEEPRSLAVNPVTN